MSYNKHTWATGNVVGAVDLNRIEQGIEDAGSSGSGEVLVVNVTYNSSDESHVLDKTWQEIYDAFPNVIIDDSFLSSKFIIMAVADFNDYYSVITYMAEYTCNSINDYPTSSEGVK